jgi:hypothetical protein
MVVWILKKRVFHRAMGDHRPYQGFLSRILGLPVGATSLLVDRSLNESSTIGYHIGQAAESACPYRITP